MGTEKRILLTLNNSFIEYSQIENVFQSELSDIYLNCGKNQIQSGTIQIRD